MGLRLSILRHVCVLLCCLWLGHGLSPTAVAETESNRWDARMTRGAHFRADMSDEEVRLTLQRALPALTDDKVAPIAKVELIRDWVHATIPVGDRYNNAADIGIDHHHNPLGELLHVAETRRAGYYCGATAEISRRVYQLLGFEAHTLNFGIGPKGETHITTLVRVTLDGRPIWTIQDTYFNFTVRYRDGRYVDYRDLLARLERAEVADVLIDEKATARTPFLFTESDKMPRISHKYAMDAICVRDHDSFAEYSVLWDFEQLVTRYKLARDLEDNLHTNNPLYLFAFPLSNSGHDDVIALQRAAENARDRILANLARKPDYYESTRVPPPVSPESRLPGQTDI